MPRSQTTTVFRIEATRGPKAGTGFYNAMPDYDDERANHLRVSAVHSAVDSWDGLHPTPFEEPALDYRLDPAEVCAFASMAQAREWLYGGALETLLEECEGFYALVAYTVPREFVRRGRRQVVFHRDAYLKREVLA
jgi:hypothetical protein